MSQLLRYEDVKNQPINPKYQNNLRIMSYNIHGFKDRSNVKQIHNIINAIKKINPDILVIQEVFLSQKNDPLTQKEIIELFSSIEFQFFAFSECGVNAVFSKIPFECQSIDLSIDPIYKVSRNALICKFPQYPEFVLAGTHLDPFDESGITRLKQIEQIYRGLKITENKNKQFVIVGDFNSLRCADYTPAEWDEILVAGEKRKIKPIEDVIPWLESHGFIDSFNQIKKKISVSVWSNRRVDYIIGLNVHFTYSDVLKTTASDHHPILADISFA